MDGWNTTFLLGRPIFRTCFCCSEAIAINIGMANFVIATNSLRTSDSSDPVFTVSNQTAGLRDTLPRFNVVHLKMAPKGSLEIPNLENLLFRFQPLDLGSVSVREDDIKKTSYIWRSKFSQNVISKPKSTWRQLPKPYDIMTTSDKKACSFSMCLKKKAFQCNIAHHMYTSEI